MKVTPKLFRLALLFVALAGGPALYSVTRGAQTTGLPNLVDRIAKLKTEIDTVPTAAGNHGERVQTMRDWGDDLTRRGRFLTQQDLNLTFARLIEPSPQLDAAIKQWIKTLSFLEEKGDAMGAVVRTDKNELIAGQYSTITLEYTVGAAEIQKGGGIRVGQNFFNNRIRLQAIDPAAESYTSFKVESKTAQTEAYVANFMGVYSSIFGPVPMPGLRVTSGMLKQGDKVTITIGDTSRNGPGYRLMTRDSDDFPFIVSADFNGDGAVIPVARISTVVYGDAAAFINAVAPSVVAVGESFSVRLRVEDQYWNPARDGRGAFKVSLNGRPVGEINVPAGKYTGQLDGVKIEQEGGYKFEVTSADGGLRCVSNPVLVERNPQRRIYWGELHGHSAEEEGYGTVPRYYEYARDVAFLDFASLTGHDLFLSQVGWEKIRRETESANRPGKFVAYMGYEWTQPFRFGGHHNVFFKTDKGRYVTRWEAPRPNQLYEKLRAIDAVDNVLIIPHAHEPGDWNFNDSELERLVEIFSMHGSFEYFGQRYLRRGYRTGFVAASDDHTGHPGYSPAVVSTRNGLAAVYSAKLDRDGVWNGMKQRATYATSNATRPVVKMTIGDRQVGEVAPAGAFSEGGPVINARVLGTAPIDHIDVIQNGKVVYRKDYLTPRPTDPAAVQIMFHTPTETPGDTVTSPRGGTGWGGWIEVSGGRIESIEPLNVDHHTDEFHQVDDRRIWFTCRTRGDFDGLLIRLAAAPADAQVKVIISDLAESAGGTGASGYVARPPGPPSRKAIHEISFKVGEVAERQAEFKPADNAYVYARKARANAPWDVSFSYRPTRPPARDDYFYLRVVHIDGEVAWVSPVWIGEQSSPSTK